MARNTSGLKKGRGRPKGARNKKTVLKELIQSGIEGVVAEELPQVVGVLLDKAKEGDMQAIQLCLKTFYASRKEVAMARDSQVSKDKTRRLPQVLNIQVVPSSGGAKDVGGEVVMDVLPERRSEPESDD